MGERQGTPAVPLDFLLPILRLRHVIHIMFGGCDLYPLTADELSLVEGIMSGKFSIPSAKEANQLLKGAASSSQKEKKRKRGPLPDTRVVDDPEAYRQSRAAASAAQEGTLPVSRSVEPSAAKSAKKAKTKSSEAEGKVLVGFPAEGSAYSDHSFVNEVTEGMLLPADRKRLTEIGPVKTTEWSLAHAYQVRRLRFRLDCICVEFFLSIECCCFVGSDGTEPAEGADCPSGEEE